MLYSVVDSVTVIIGVIFIVIVVFSYFQWNVGRNKSHTASEM